MRRCSELNRTWRGKDSPTNVLSFPATETAEGALPEPEFDGVPLELGDVVLAYETVRARSWRHRASGSPTMWPIWCVHGVLHLLGYDHLDDAEAAADGSARGPHPGRARHRRSL